MATYNIVKMHFTTPLHLSRGQTDSYDRSEEVLHSDTIKSAVFVAAKMLFGSEIDEGFFDSFKVSSAFPFHDCEYFFPKPMDRLNIPKKENEDTKSAKQIKKISYLGQSIFENQIAGNTIEFTEKHLDKSKKFLFSEPDKNDVLVFKSEVQQRLAMPKPEKDEEGNIVMKEDGTPYYIDRIYFTENSGLYFFIEYLQNLDKNKIEAAIRLLGDEGVGTDKHIGNGLFEPCFDTLDLELPENANSQLLLSLYLPEKEELAKNLLNKSSYQLIKRGGYIASPENIEFLTFRKKSIYMFLEASIFPNEMTITGKKADLKLDFIGHSVWRDGRAFSIPYIKNGKERK